MLQIKVVKKNQNTYSLFSNFLPKIAPFMRYVEKRGGAREAAHNMAPSRGMQHKFFRSHNGFVRASRCYVTRTLPVLVFHKTVSTITSPADLKRPLFAKRFIVNTKVCTRTLPPPKKKTSTDDGVKAEVRGNRVIFLRLILPLLSC
jgi:hypothetical protein